MGIIFISHSSRNNNGATKIRDWLRDQGWGETFLDLDPAHGLAPGQKWQEELKKAGERCSAVVVLISPDWVQSKWCQVEFLLASQLGKRIFGITIIPTPFAELPIELTAHYQIVDISDPAKEAEGLERLRFGLKRAGLDPNDFPWPPQNEPDRSPYRGLRSLEEKDAGIFFGRDAPITKGLDALRRIRDGAPERIMVVLGASGAGKSSFLKAGLLARLQRDEEHFIVLPTVRPERAALTGAHGLLDSLRLSSVSPCENLAARFAAIRQPVIERLQRSAEAARESPPPKPPTLVLPIDQAEELFASDNSENHAFMDLLRNAFAVDDNLVAIATIRSDSYASLQGEPRLVDVPRLPFDLPRLSLGAFKELIEGPGRLAKRAIAFEPELTDRLVADLDDADALPLLAFTLQRLVADYGEDGKLQLDDYERGLGGLNGAVSKAIEAAFAAAVADPSLPSERIAIEALARQALIPWLVRVDDSEGVPKRRVATLSELPGEARRLVSHLIDQRLLVTDVHAGEATVEVSHEAVLRHWTALRVWIDEERAHLRAAEGVRIAASQWRRHTSDTDAMHSESWLVHTGERLVEAEALLQRPDFARMLGDDGRGYLAACRAREQRQFARQRTLQHRIAAALAGVALVLVAFGYFAVAQSRAASRQVSIVLVDYARRAAANGEYERAMRFAALGARQGLLDVAEAAAAPMLARAAGSASLLRELPLHEEGEISLLQSSDGRRVLSWGEDGTVRVSDVASGAELGQQKHTGAAGAVFAPDGSRVLSWGGDGTARVWDAGSGREIARQTHERAVRGGVFSGDGRWVLSWGADETIRVWSTTSGAEIARYAHDDVRSAKFAEDGNRVLSWGFDGTARVWNATSGTEIARQTHSLPINGAEFAYDGLRVLSWGTDRTARVWSASSGTEIARQSHKREVYRAEFAPDGLRVLSWDEDGTMVVWNGASGAEIARYTHKGLLGAMFSADGQRVLTWGNDGTARVWNAKSGIEIARQTHKGQVLGAIFARDGERVLSWGDDGAALVWAVASSTEIARQTHTGTVAGARFARDDQYVLSWGADGTARVWAATSGAEIMRQTHKSEVAGAFFARDGRRVFSWSADGVLRVWDAWGAEIAHQGHQGRVNGAVFAADDRRVLSWGADGMTQIWVAASGMQIARQTHTGGAVGAVFAADGQRVLSWGADGIARVWSAASGVEIARQKHSSAVGGAFFAADGQRVLSWSEDGIARVWMAASGIEIAHQTHRGGVVGALFSVDGQRVLSWGKDGTARVWDSASGKEISRQTHTDWVRGAVFSPDGHHVLSWDDDVARVWDATSGAEIARQTDEVSDGGVFSPDGKRVLSWHFFTVRVWDASTGKKLGSQRHGQRIESVDGAVFSDDGQRVLSWGSDDVARVWAAASGTEIARQMHEDSVQGAVFDDAGQRVLSWDHAGSVRIWAATSGAEIARQTHTGSANGAVFAPGGKRVLSWSRDGTARVWAVDSGTEIARQTHIGAVLGAVFAADRQRALSWDDAGVMSVWDVSWSVPRTSNAALIAEVCERKLRGTDLPRGFTSDRSGETRAIDSVRRISVGDVLAAPLLRDRVGEDVCRAPTLTNLIGSKVSRLFDLASTR